ncbi:hypothetical protein Cgig2_001463 [Carnegiea gigantea]|uniref:Protein EARLY RESPONSIVE TO DEHYDRATION 15 n=1 Tax=Carnegiea gigantea TaxID=171969 RepID=A0A9Q1KWD6_9CARY|nr:hypothetical protein Cgig2_001463 [Carnegiea gigantea]
MALVSGRSTLNPNAPLYIPAAFRRVEDFSPEWWDLITTSLWFRDYWLSQHQEAEIMYGNNQNSSQGDDVVDLLPDDIDLGVDEELLNMESQFEEFIKFSGNQESKLLPKDGWIKSWDGVSGKTGSKEVDDGLEPYSEVAALVSVLVDDAVCFESRDSSRKM